MTILVATTESYQHVQMPTGANVAYLQASMADYLNIEVTQTIIYWVCPTNHTVRAHLDATLLPQNTYIAVPRWTPLPPNPKLAPLPPDTAKALYPRGSNGHVTFQLGPSTDADPQPSPRRASGTARRSGTAERLWWDLTSDYYGRHDRDTNDEQVTGDGSVLESIVGSMPGPNAEARLADMRALFRDYHVPASFFQSRRKSNVDNIVAVYAAAG